MAIQQNACALHAGYLRLQTHAQSKLFDTYSFSHSNNGYANASQCYVIRTLPLLLMAHVMLYADLIQIRRKQNRLLPTHSG